MTSNITSINTKGKSGDIIRMLKEVVSLAEDEGLNQMIVTFVTNDGKEGTAMVYDNSYHMVGKLEDIKMNILLNMDEGISDGG